MAKKKVNIIGLITVSILLLTLIIGGILYSAETRATSNGNKEKLDRLEDIPDQISGIKQDISAINTNLEWIKLSLNGSH